MKRAHRNNLLTAAPPDTLNNVSPPECPDGTTGLRGRLSTSQLLFRRGLTILVTAALLALGVTVHIVVPLPQDLASQNKSMDWLNSTDFVSTVVVKKKESY